MKSLPTQTRARMKRTALIEAAILNFSEWGYEATTAKTVAARAGVATGTFYQYFDNKDDILRVVAQQRMEQLQADVAPTGIELIPDNALDVGDDIKAVFRRVLSLIYDFHQQTPELHQVLEHRRNIDASLARILDQGEAVLEQRVRLFVQSFNVESPETVAFNLFAMAEGLVHRHVFSESSVPKTEVLDLGAAMLASYFEKCEKLS
ncbi:TetR/AcrR family transcriptional regulator [Aestuariirhabdus sp. Z084]|uniref:TetR/AcrR family transcriptional regulator n=1 Tax=Aestuariirhabdus haliotis TaxID=2918751 RepID=UPI00201B44C4|nr:TetR/AcrR family transcriptional regulator [Aestuariirhabdus haliotis]MCL6416731.1 TetR/AcrR family transcriptional regulator [Aestuariirhabdus haliotis]MCL6420731.1 TetR/AcrR family transcriptional regulator [Aestuariirhabdus haliotis]